MFQYEYEKRPPSSASCDSRATVTTDWSRHFPSLPEERRSLPRAPEDARDRPTGNGDDSAYQTGHKINDTYQSGHKINDTYQTGHKINDTYQSGHKLNDTYQNGHRPTYQPSETYQSGLKETEYQIENKSGTYRSSRDDYSGERETYQKRHDYQSSGEGKDSYGRSQKAYPGHKREYPGTREGYGGEQKAYPGGYEGYRSRPLPPRPVCDRVPSKSTVPLKVWVIASASCFAVCAALVLATVVIARWGAPQGYTRETTREEDLIYSNSHAIYITPKPLPAERTIDNNGVDDEIDTPVLETLSIFKNVVTNREKNKKTDDLVSKPQLHPVHDTAIEHLERKIEKKDQAKMPSHVEIAEILINDVRMGNNKLVDDNRPFNNDKRLNEVSKFDRLGFGDVKRPIPEFKPTLPDVFLRNHGDIKLPDGYTVGWRKHDVDYEEYYNDNNFYDDYMQSNTMTSYLIEKVQELHDWIMTDPDFEMKNATKVARGTEFSQVLKALNDSLVQGNVSIIMSKLKDIYFGDNYTSVNHSHRKLIVSNSTDLFSFGILTLDIMLLHNIQLMAWENQEAARIKMLKDPDVFAFNALFMDPAKVEAKRNELMMHENPGQFAKRQNLRQDMDEFDAGKSLLENFLEVGLSTARAALHLGRAYKNTKAVLSQLSNRDTNVQPQLSRNIEDNAVALDRLQNSFQEVSCSSPTTLDCVWLLYCRNLAASSKLNAPYGTMVRINGMALKMLVGALPTERALDTMVYEALTGWTDLKCDELFPRCSKANAASVVMDTILQPLRKTQANRL